MNRFPLIIVATLQLVSVLTVASAQDSAPTAGPTTPCPPPQQSSIIKPTLKVKLNTSPVEPGRSRRCSPAPQKKAAPPLFEFYGLNALSKAAAIKQLQEELVISESKPLDPEKAAVSLTEILASRGYARAQVQVLSHHEGIVRLLVNEGSRVPLAKIQFEGNTIFSHDELSSNVRGCLTRKGERDLKDYQADLLEYCQRLLVNHIRSSGYLEAKIIQNVQVSETGYMVSFVVNEGTLYRLGKVKLEGQDAVNEEQIKSRLTIREGEIVNSDKLSKWLFDDLKNVYADLGFIHYTAEPIPTFNREQGTVDLEIQIEEGERYSLNSITFIGDLIEGINPEDLLLIPAGERYSSRVLREGIARLNSSGLFEPVDADKDIDFRTNEEELLVELIIKLKKRN